MMTNLARIRKERGLSQASLSQKSRVGIRAIQLCEQKERDINKAAAINVYRLSQVLGCEVKDLLELEDASSKR